MDQFYSHILEVLLSSLAAKGLQFKPLVVLQFGFLQPGAVGKAVMRIAYAKLASPDIYHLRRSGTLLNIATSLLFILIFAH